MDNLIIKGYSYWPTDPKKHFPVRIIPEAFDAPIKSLSFIKDKFGKECTVIDFERPLTRMSNRIFAFLPHRSMPDLELEESINQEYMSYKIESITLPDTLVDYLPDSYSESYMTYSMERMELLVLGKYSQKECLWVVDGDVKFWSGLLKSKVNANMDSLTGIKSVPPYFYSRVSLEGKLILPEGLECMGHHAFSDISDLNEIKLPKSLKRIAPYAMSNNRWMTKINLANIEEIGEFAFSHNIFRKVKLGRKLKSIGNGAFTKRVRGSHPVFEGPEEFVKEDGKVLISNELMVLLPAWTYDYSFGFSKTEEYTVPEGITQLGSYSGGESFGTVNLPNTMLSIGKSAFVNSYLREINLPESLTEIGENAFYCCRNIKTITIPAKVTELRKSVFIDCESLVSLIVLGELTVFHHSLFLYDKAKSAFERFELRTNTPPAFIKPDMSKNSYDYLAQGIIVVPKGSVEKYKSAEGWKEYAYNIIPGNF